MVEESDAAFTDRVIGEARAKAGVDGAGSSDAVGEVSAEHAVLVEAMQVSNADLALHGDGEYTQIINDFAADTLGGLARLGWGLTRLPARPLDGPWVSWGGDGVGP